MSNIASRKGELTKPIAAKIKPKAPRSICRLQRATIPKMVARGTNTGGKANILMMPKMMEYRPVVLLAFPCFSGRFVLIIVGVVHPFQAFLNFTITWISRAFLTFSILKSFVPRFASAPCYGDEK